MYLYYIAKVCTGEVARGDRGGLSLVGMGMRGYGEWLPMGSGNEKVDIWGGRVQQAGFEPTSGVARTVLQTAATKPGIRLCCKYSPAQCAPSGAYAEARASRHTPEGMWGTMSTRPDLHPYKVALYTLAYSADALLVASACSNYLVGHPATGYID